MKGGKPYVMFGDGQLAACKPISEADLAAFIADCVQGEDRVNQMLPIGGVSGSRARLSRSSAICAGCCLGWQYPDPGFASASRDGTHAVLITRTESSGALLVQRHHLA